MGKNQRGHQKSRVSMTYHDLAKRGFIKRANIQREEVVAAFQAAMEELSAATLLLEKKYPTQAFRLAVESMVMSAVSLLYNEGYRNRHRAIKALVLFIETYFGEENKSLVNKFDYYRQHRNTRAFYVMGRFDPTVEPKLAKEAMETARQLLDIVRDEIKYSKNPTEHAPCPGIDSESFQTGRIKKYLDHRGFGFIAPENEDEDLFFHITDVVDVLQLKPGTMVKYQVIETSKGLNAVNVQAGGSNSVEGVE